jgi:hypothetical protein
MEEVEESLKFIAEARREHGRLKCVYAHDVPLDGEGGTGNRFGLMHGFK